MSRYTILYVILQLLTLRTSAAMADILQAVSDQQLTAGLNLSSPSTTSSSHSPAAATGEKLICADYNLRSCRSWACWVCMVSSLLLTARSAEPAGRIGVSGTCTAGHHHRISCTVKRGLSSPVRLQLHWCTNRHCPNARSQGNSD